MQILNLSEFSQRIRGGAERTMAHGNQLAFLFVKLSPVSELPVGLLECQYRHAFFWKLSPVPVGVRGVEWYPCAFPRVPCFDPQSICAVPVPEEKSGPYSFTFEYGQESLCKLATPSISKFKKIIH